MGQAKPNPVAAPAAFNEILGVLNAQIDECLKEVVHVPRSRHRTRRMPEGGPPADMLQQSKALGELPGRHSAVAVIRRFIAISSGWLGKAALITAVVAIATVLTVALQYA
jgi:hypothetical protein